MHYCLILLIVVSSSSDVETCQSEEHTSSQNQSIPFQVDFTQLQSNNMIPIPHEPLVQLQSYNNNSHINMVQCFNYVNALNILNAQNNFEPNNFKRFNSNPLQKDNEINNELKNTIQNHKGETIKTIKNHVGIQKRRKRQISVDEEIHKNYEYVRNPRVLLEDYVPKMDMRSIYYLSNLSIQTLNSTYLKVSYNNFIYDLNNCTNTTERKIDIFKLYFLNTLCDYNKNHVLIIKKCFCLLMSSIADLIPYIYLFNHQIDNLKKAIISNEDKIFIIEKVGTSLYGLIIAYIRFLKNYVVPLNGIDDLTNETNIYDEMRFNLHFYTQNFRESIAPLNFHIFEYVEKNAAYNFFLNHLYKKPNKKKSINTNNEKFLLCCLIMSANTINNMFRNSTFDDTIKTYKLSDNKSFPTISYLFSTKKIIEGFNDDLMTFLASFKDDYLYDLQNFNFFDKYIYKTTQQANLYFINYGIDEIGLHRKFYATNTSYVNAIYEIFVYYILKYGCD